MIEKQKFTAVTIKGMLPYKYTVTERILEGNFKQS